MTWIRIDDKIGDNPKIVAAGEAAAWLYVVGLCYCSQHLTDGSIPSRIVLRLTSNRYPGRLAARLVEQGLWIETADGYEVVDYLGHQRSRSEVMQHRERGKERAFRSRERNANPPKRSREPARPELETELETEEPLRGVSKSRMPEGWKPAPQTIQHLANEGWSQPLQARELAKFRNHADANARQVHDWDAAYSLWVRREPADRISKDSRFVCVECGAEDRHCECGYDAEFTIELGGLT